ncbi:MAG: hypothetical protein ISS58_05875 [Dehalococcoidales bacterium]|nr:hypothetical protein [Dehalococcoidales bacterium]
MKRKISKIWGVGLVIVLAATLLLSAAPVSAGTASWSSFTIPSSTNNVVVAGADVTDFAVGGDGTTIWAVDATTPKVYKSTDAGLTWSDKTSAFTAVTGFVAPYRVAIAPDDNDIVAIACNTVDKVAVTTNGGTSFGDLGTTQQGVLGACTQINDIAISAEDSGTHYVAVAGDETTPLGNVWYFNVGAAAPAWTETNSLAGWGSLTSDRAMSVAFSPNFASDQVMVAITQEDAIAVLFEIFSFSTDLWNTNAGFASYPVSVIANADATIGGISAADISLAPEYLGSDDAMRLAFVGVTVTGSTAKDGIYRFSDTSKKEVKVDVDVNSVAYNGTNLVAGEFASNVTYHCSDPLATTPTVSTTTSLKRPGMDTAATEAVVVAWSGDDVVAGTSGDDSAFSVSRDDGKSYSDISLIDAAAMNVRDVAVSPDGTKVYVVTDDAADTSLWRKASAWERVLAVDSVAGCIVRTAPDDPDVVYVADLATKVMYYSNTAGDTKWFNRASRYDVQDIAVEGNGDVVYIIYDGTTTVSKSTNRGFTWASAKSTGISATAELSTITSLGEDMLIAGSDAGYVGYTADGNSSWSTVTVQLTHASATQVTASGLADGDFIYAAVAGANDTVALVERWEIGTSTSWKDLGAATTTDLGGDGTADECGAFGIALVEGVLYVAMENIDTNAGSADSVVFSTLDPHGSAPTWSMLVSADETFVTTPSALRTSEGSTVLWALDTTGQKLFSYTDTMSAAGPALLAPAHGGEISMNPVSGTAYDVSFTWERASKADIYQVDVSFDYDFAERFPRITTTSTTASTVAQIAGPSGTAGTNLINFMPETTYYWRVRASSTEADTTVYSPWSAARSFTVAELPEAQAPVIIQQPPAPVISVPPAPNITLQPPEIVLPAPPPAPPEIVIPAAPAPTPPVPTWAIYAIIIIGAVLVIALIVLIMRTRRPV